MNGFEHAADTSGQSTSNLMVAHRAESSVRERQNGHYEEVDRLRQEVRELQAQVLHGVAAAKIAAFWFVVPVAALSGMYCMTGSAIGPLYLAGGFVLIGAMNYLLLNWMLIASAELDLERPSAVVTDVVPHPATTRRIASDNFGPGAASPADKSPSRLNGSKRW
jgi:hypothetical protein